MKVTSRVFQRSDGYWEWHLIAANGQIIATSGNQGFTQRSDAVRSYTRVRALMAQAQLAERDA